MAFNRAPRSNPTALGAADVSAPVFDRVVRLPEVLEIVGIGRTSLYKLVKSGRFPAPLHLSERIRGWRISDIQRFLATRPSGGRHE